MTERGALMKSMAVGLTACLAGCAGPTSAVAQKVDPAPPPVVAQMAPEKTLDRALDSLAQQIAASLPADKKPLTAVLDFNDLAGNVSAFGRLVSEELVTKLFQTKRVRVVERGLLEKALNELKFNLSEVVDPTRAKQLGKQVGADAIVIGTITDMGSTVKINARLIEVERGDVLAAAGVEATKDGVVGRLMSQILTSPGKGPATSPPAAKTAEASPAPSPPAPMKDLPKFENQGIRVTVRSLKKDGNVLRVELVYRSLLDVGKPDIALYLDSERNQYIVDEEGGKWLLQQDSQFSKGHHKNDVFGFAFSSNVFAFSPQVNRRMPLNFMATDSTSGKVFNLVLDHRCSSNCDAMGQQVRVIIRNITAE